MKLRTLWIAAFLALMTIPCCRNNKDLTVTVGAARTAEYIDGLKGRRVALFSNQTGVVDGEHVLDLLLREGVDVVTIFSPEHGFRGEADAGESVSSSVDEKTGVKITSLYGSGFDYRDSSSFKGIDVIVSDIQDVGLRFYTYYVTMIKLMESAARFDRDFVVLDRPNPNGMYVDGPVLDMKYRSGVGRLPIPVVHGLTLGEMALMANGEGWLDDGLKVKNLKVVSCEGYTHQTRYELPVAPSPNLKSMHAIYLYPSLCYFEATPVSVGRGTDSPFEFYGHPDFEAEGEELFSFTPVSMPGAKSPEQMGNLCFGRDLRGIPDEEIIANGLDLSYLIDAYNHIGNHEGFFRNSFERLIGRGDIRAMIEEGRSAEEIKSGWARDVEDFKILRRKYLLYEE